jgi:hypothetical protein
MRYAISIPILWMGSILFFRELEDEEKDELEDEGRR